MAQITELKHEDQTRRRTSRTVAVLGGVVVVAGAGWLAISQLGGSEDATPQPMSSPSVVSSPPVTLTPGEMVGANLPLPLKAKAPTDWTVSSDAGYVWLDADDEPWGASVQIGGPVEKVWDYRANRPVGVSIGGCFEVAGCESYASYLLGHPSLELVSSERVVVDGREFDQLTFRVKDDAPSTPGYDGVILAKFDGIDSGQPWSEVAQGSIFTDTVLELAPGRADNPTMVVTAAGAETAEETAAQDSALDLVLSTMKLPDRQS